VENAGAFGVAACALRVADSDASSIVSARTVDNNRFIFMPPFFALYMLVTFRGSQISLLDKKDVVSLFCIKGEGRFCAE
jgi:hypothetical protein